jgi:hypothetical protein
LDDAQFTSSRNINSQNNKHCWYETLLAVCEVSFTSPYSTVTACKISKYMFFEEANSDHQTKLTDTIFREVTDKQKM